MNKFLVTGRFLVLGVSWALLSCTATLVHSQDISDLPMVNEYSSNRRMGLVTVEEMNNIAYQNLTRELPYGLCELTYIVNSGCVGRSKYQTLFSVLYDPQSFEPWFQDNYLKARNFVPYQIDSFSSPYLKQDVVSLYKGGSLSFQPLCLELEECEVATYNAPEDKSEDMRDFEDNCAPESIPEESLASLGPDSLHEDDFEHDAPSNNVLGNIIIQSIISILFPPNSKA